MLHMCYVYVLHMYVTHKCDMYVLHMCVAYMCYTYVLDIRVAYMCCTYVLHTYMCCHVVTHVGRICVTSTTPRAHTLAYAREKCARGVCALAAVDVTYMCPTERWGAGVEYHFQEFNEPYAPS